MLAGLVLISYVPILKEAGLLVGQIIGLRRIIAVVLFVNAARIISVGGTFLFFLNFIFQLFTNPLSRKTADFHLPFNPQAVALTIFTSTICPHFNLPAGNLTFLLVMVLPNTKSPPAPPKGGELLIKTGTVRPIYFLFSWVAICLRSWLIACARRFFSLWGTLSVSLVATVPGRGE